MRARPARPRARRAAPGPRAARRPPPAPSRRRRTRAPTVTAPASDARAPIADPAPIRSTPPRASSRAPSPMRHAAPRPRSARPARREAPRRGRSARRRRARSARRAAARARTLPRQVGRGGTTASAPTVSSMPAHCDRASSAACIRTAPALACRNEPIPKPGSPEGRMADDDVTALLSGKKKRKKRKRKRCRVVKQQEARRRQAQDRQGPQVQAAQEGEAEAAAVYVAPAFVPAPPVPPPPPPPRLKTIKSPIAVYARHVRPRAGRAPRVARRLRPAPRPGRRARRAGPRGRGDVASRARPAWRRSTGPSRCATARTRSSPASDDGAAIYWLDRMVRSRHQLVERLALVFHDWWATRRDGVEHERRDARADEHLPRARPRHRSATMARAITADPAMLQFLDGDRPTAAAR